MSIIPLNEQEIRYQVSQIKELPSLPQAFEKLIEIIRSEIDSPGELESIISYDPSLVAKLVMVGNSAWYGYGGRVNTLSKAINVIGLYQVKAICICALIMNLLVSGHPISAVYREMLWKHSFVTSRILTEMTKKRPWLDRDEASILGLLHDLGWIVMAAHFKDQFTAIFETAAKRNIPPWYVDMQYGLTHTQIGKYLASRWAFPEVLKAAIEFHHFPEKSKTFKTEVRLIYLANVLSHSHEFPELVNDEVTICHCRELYVCEEEWQEYQEKVELIWYEVDELWNLLK
ncbi:MAG: HDOD domain-containing protein [Syntrophobacteraceae bacterium]|jgi:HD-like signal output (HDOD) protein